jgi:DnaJ-class molecular chaperone
MKDLYAKLGIDQHASQSEVTAALQSRPELSAFSTVLLNAEKRAVYDRAHTALKAIGQLRHKLGLDSGESWFLQNCADYVPRQRSAVSAEKSPAAAGSSAPRQAPSEAAQSPIAPAQPAARSVRPALVVIAIAAVLVAIAAIVLI